MRRSLWYLLTISLAIASVSAQPVIRLKTRQIAPRSTEMVTQADTPAPFGRGHLILQFVQTPTPLMIRALNQRGATVLQAVPENALLVAIERPVDLAGLGVVYARPLDPADKISPLITAGDPSIASGHLVVDFYADVDPGSARSLVLGLGIALQDNPDLADHQLLIHVSDPAAIPSSVAMLAAQDAISYIFPASAELIGGTPAPAYAAPITTLGPVTQMIPTFGDGWDGPGLNATTISYVFSQMSTHVDPAQAKAAILRAMAEWSKVVAVTWQPGVSATAPRTVNILFASYNHGDGYPFDGPGGVLAHTFYPAPPNPEPIAGDMHLDDSESWNIGVNTDVFSVALHELGHALGLGHSDNPNDVMYPYYKQVTTLAAGDKAAILTMYAAATATAPAPPPAPTPAPVPPPTPAPVPPPPPPTPTPAPVPPPPPTPAPGGDITPPTLTILSPGGSTVSASSNQVSFTGTASDNVGVARVMWSTNTGSSGTASGTTNWSASIPVLVGSNTVTIRAYDAAGNSSWRSVVVSRH